MDYKAIQELMKTMNESGLYSLEIESDGTRIKMSKGPQQVVIGSVPENQKASIKVQNQMETASIVESKEEKIFDTISEYATAHSDELTARAMN